MPSTSEKQRRTMAAAAHDPAFAKKMGIPQKVAKEFNKADQRKAGHLSSTKVHVPSGPQMDPVEHHAMQAQHHWMHGLEKPKK